MICTIYGTASSEGFPALFCECEYCTHARKPGKENNRKRSTSCIDDKILIDFGPDILAQTQMGLKLTDIEYLFFTHSHTDHLNINDLHYIIEPFAETREGRKIHIYGSAAVYEKLERYFIEERYSGKLDFTLLENGVTVEADGYRVTPILTNHDAKEDCYIYVIQRDKKTLLFGTDSAVFPEQTMKMLSEYKYNAVIFDCTSIQKGKYFANHMGLPDNRQMEDQLRALGAINDETQIYVTHFAHSFDPSQEHVSKAAAEYGYIAAYDGIRVRL